VQGTSATLPLNTSRAEAELLRVTRVTQLMCTPMTVFFLECWQQPHF